MRVLMCRIFYDFEHAHTQIYSSSWCDIAPVFLATLTVVAGCAPWSILPFQMMSQIHAPQTKILEGGTKDEIRISKEALFNGS
jgi:hypothetical protein